jgi:hypothetical protein
MHLLELILVIILAPFWFPILLTLIGVSILVFGILVLVFSILSLCFIVWILKTLYEVHVGLVTARQMVLADIENGFNSKMSLWRFGRLIFIKYRKQIYSSKEFKKEYLESQNQEEIFDE